MGFRFHQKLHHGRRAWLSPVSQPNNPLRPRLRRPRAGQYFSKRICGDWVSAGAKQTTGLSTTLADKFVKDENRRQEAATRILLSSTYQQCTARESHKVDPDNKLLAVFPASAWMPNRSTPLLAASGRTGGRIGGYG